jgi:signal transduction histidine kinase
VSAAVEPLTGFSPQELVGSSAIIILEDSSAFALPRILAEAAENGFWEGDIAHRTRSGERRLADGMVSPLAGPKNAGYLLLSNLNGPQAENETDQSALAAVSMTLRSYAHDLNNPLTVMMGFTQLLLLNDACSGKVRDDLEKVFAGLQQVVRLVGEMHQYAYSICESPQK